MLGIAGAIAVFLPYRGFRGASWSFWAERGTPWPYAGLALAAFAIAAIVGVLGRRQLPALLAFGLAFACVLRGDGDIPNGAEFQLGRQALLGIPVAGVIATIVTMLTARRAPDRS
jgi:hypothetical protein